MNMVGTTMILLLILLMILMLAFSGVAIVVITVMIVAIDCSCKEEWLWSEIHSVLSGWGSSQHTSYWGVWFTVLWDSHVARPLHAHMQSWKSWQNPTVVCISIYMCVCVCSTEEAIKSEARNLPTYVCVCISIIQISTRVGYGPFCSFLMSDGLFGVVCSFRPQNICIFQHLPTITDTHKSIQL